MFDQINIAIGYLHGLWRYRWSALLVTWFVFIAGCFGVYALPDQYESNATVNIDTSSIMTPLLDGLAVNTDHSAELGLMVQVLLSRETLLTVIRNTKADHGTETPEQLEKHINKLRKSIIITSRSRDPDRGAGPFSATYKIGFQSPSAVHAYGVVNELVNTMLEEFQNMGRTDTVMAQDFLDKQIREYEKKLEIDEKRLADFKKKNMAFMADERGGYYARLRDSQVEIDNTKSSLREAKQRYSELRTQLSRQSPMLSSSGNSGVPRSMLQQYREQLADLLTRFTDNHPDVQALRSKIAYLEKGNVTDQDVAGSAEYNPVYQELKVQESSARIEVGRLQIKLAEQQQKLEEFQQSIDIIPQVEADLVKLNRDYEITKERYLSLVERRESARLAQEVERDSSTIAFTMIEPPIVPVLPSGPNRLLFLSGFLLVSLVAGVGWSLLQFMLYPVFVDSKQAKNILALPVLGSVTLHLGAEQKRGRKLKLANFLLSIVLLLVCFGGVLVFAEQGSEFTRLLLASLLT